MSELHKTNGDCCEPLSDAGQDRKRAILEALKAQTPRIAAARRRQRLALVSSVCIAAVASVAFLVARQPGSGLPPPPSSQPPLAHVEPAPSLRIEIVSTRVEPTTVAISDDELLVILRSMGRTTGLARIGDRVILTDPVADAQLRERRNPPVVPPAPNESDREGASAADVEASLTAHSRA